MNTQSFLQTMVFQHEYLNLLQKRSFWHLVSEYRWNGFMIEFTTPTGVYPPQTSKQLTYQFFMDSYVNLIAQGDMRVSRERCYINGIALERLLCVFYDHRICFRIFIDLVVNNRTWILWPLSPKATYIPYVFERIHDIQWKYEINSY